jgi:hypothetical protein
MAGSGFRVQGVRVRLAAGDLPSMVSLIVDGTDVSEQFHADGPGNEAMVIDAPLQAGLKRGNPTPNSWLGSAAPAGCGAAPGAQAGALPNGLPEVELDLPE